MQVETIRVLAMVLAVLVLYALPCIIAVAKGKRDKVSIIVPDLLEGWTGAGWIITLVWSLMNHPAPVRQ